MAEQLSIQKKLEYIVQCSERRESEVLADALEFGLEEMYRNQIRQAYLSGKITNEEAAAKLGKPFIQELDYAREAVTQDIQWGLVGE